MRKVIFFICIILFISSHIYSKDKYKNIGVLTDGDWWRNDELISLIKSEINSLSDSDFEFDILSKNILSGDWNKANIKNNLEKLLNDEEIDIVVVLGIISAETILKNKTYKKPVIVPVFKGLIDDNLLEDGKSNIENLNLIYINSSFEEDIISLKKAFEFKKLTLLINNLLKDYYKITPLIEKFFNANNIEYNVLYIKENFSEVIEKINSNSEAVYISPLSIHSKEDLLKLTKFLVNKKIKSFYGLGRMGIESGLLATNRNPFIPKLARRIALNIQRISIGDKPEKIPVQFYHEQNLTINIDVADKIDFYPGWDLLSEADLINEPEEIIDSELSLNDVIQETLKSNLDLKAYKKSVLAGQEDVSNATSRLLPSLDLSATGLMIDEDRAASSMGSLSERSIKGSIKATQLLYSEKSWTNLSIQKSLQDNRTVELEQKKLDVILEAGNNFLNLLKAETFKRIQKENLDRVKSNMGIARIREATGSSGPAEVYRWESELAKSRSDFIKAKANKKAAMLAVNRLMNKPMGYLFQPTKNNVYLDRLIKVEKIIPKYLGNKKLLKIFEKFIVQRGFENSIELKQIKNAIDIRRISLKSAKHSFWSPTLALQAEVGYNFSKSGAGSSGMNFSALPPEQNFLANLFPSQPDDLNWSIALNVSFPLFQGGGKFAQHSKAKIELDEIQIQQKSVKEKIEQRIRSTLYMASASYASIRQTQLRAEAAEKSLRVITDAYSRGTLSVIELLDAQNAYVLSQESASNALYDFLIDILILERAAGEFFIRMDEDERQKYLMELEKFYQDYR